MIALENEIALEHEETSLGRFKEAEAIKSEILSELERLQKEILEKKGKEREKAMKSYRELLRLMKDEPLYISKYE